MKKWSWICEYCYGVLYDTPILPDSWLWVFQSAICPDCQKQAIKEHGEGFIYVAKCGCYANCEDPRKQK